LFDCLLNKLNAINNDVEIEKPLSELNGLEPDDFFMWSTKNKDYDSYIRVLRKIVLQLDETKLDEFFQFLKEIFDYCDDYVYISYVKILEAISLKFNKWHMGSLNFLHAKGLDTSNLDERQLAHLLRYIEDRIKTDNFALDVTSFKKKILRLNGTRLHNLFQEGFNHKDYHVRHSYGKLLESIASELNEQQIRSIFGLLLKGPNNKYANIRCLYAKVLQEIVSKLSGTQLHNLPSILKEKFNNKYYEVQYLCVKIPEKISCIKILQTISPKLNNEQIDSLLQYLGYESNHGDDSTHNSCAKILRTISPKLNTEQINSLLQCLENGFNDGDDSIHNSCAKILQTISPKLNNKQLSNILQCLSNRFNLNDDNLQNSSQKIFGIITARLKKGSLNETVEYLEYESKDYDIKSWILYTKIMPSISKELNEQQLDITFNFRMNELLLEMIVLESNETQLNNLLYYLQNKFKNRILSNLNERKIDTFKILMDGINNTNYEVRNLYVNVLVTKLNDEQLCLLINNFLKDTPVSDKANSVLSKISDDMWRRVVITTLNTKIEMGKKNIEMELLALCLLKYNPRIQFTHNNNDNIINSEAFKELIDCCNKQAMKLGFSIQQKWSDYDTLQIKLQLQQSNSYIYKGLNAFIHEAAKLSDMKSSLECHPIHNKHWDTARYCIEQGAWID
ncbi:hypothetical protein RFI_39269, partial [Reticulomyxa filosa]